MITTAHRPSCKIDTITNDIDAECRWCTSYKMAGITQALIRAHLTIRDDFRKTKQYKAADTIRTFLESLGVEVKDRKVKNDKKS